MSCAPSPTGIVPRRAAFAQANDAAVDLIEHERVALRVDREAHRPLGVALLRALVTKLARAAAPAHRRDLARPDSRNADTNDEPSRVGRPGISS